MNDARRHGAVSESRVLAAVEDCNSSLIEHRYGALVDLGGLCRAGTRRGVDISSLRTAADIAGEVIPAHQYGLQNGMRRIHAGINHSDYDACTRSIES